MRTARVTLAALAALAIVVWFPGCREGDGGGGDYPAPGAMRVISVSPIKPPPSASLLPSSTFEEWHAGAPMPAAPIVLPKRGSTVARCADDAREGQICMKQTWQEKDDLWSPEPLFCVPVSGLMKDTSYSLTVNAKVLGEQSVVVEVYGVAEGGRRWPMNLPLIQVAAKTEWQEYQASFTTGLLPDILIATACYKLPEGATNEVLWDGWSLYETGPLPKPEITPLGLIQNGSFEVWHTGAPAPEGPFIPPDTGLARSTLMPMLRTRRDGNVALLQTWTASDREDAPDTLFAAQLEVKPNTDYTFSYWVHTFGKHYTFVLVYGIDQQNEFTTISEPLLSVEPAQEWQEQAASFNSGEFSKIRIATAGPKNKDLYPSKVILDAWKLVESAPK